MPRAYYMIIILVFWQNQLCDTQVPCMQTLVGNNIIFNSSKHQCFVTPMLLQLHLELVVTRRTLQKQWWDCRSNWTPQEMITVVNAQRDNFLNEFDFWTTLQMLGTSWMQRQQSGLRSRLVYDSRFFSICKQDDTSCKGKYNLLLPKYRHIAKHHARMMINDDDYWSEQPKGVPKSFVKTSTSKFTSGLDQKTQIQPPSLCEKLVTTPRWELSRGYEDTLEDEVKFLNHRMDDESIDHHEHSKTMDWLNTGAKVGHLSRGNVWLNRVSYDMDTYLWKITWCM